MSMVVERNTTANNISLLNTEKGLNYTEKYGYIGCGTCRSVTRGEAFKSLHRINRPPH